MQRGQSELGSLGRFEEPAVLILTSLVEGPRHGYAIGRWIRETTSDDVVVQEGALYPALHRLERRGWIKATWGASENNRKAKFYALTRAGRKQLDAQTGAWRALTSAVDLLLDTP